MNARATLPFLTLLALVTNVAMPVTSRAEDESIRTARVPDLRGKRTNLARQLARLSEVKFASGVFYIAPENWRDELRPERVYLQTPQASTLIPTGAPVVCWTFDKAAPNTPIVNVPNLDGQTLAAAQQAVNDCGLTLINEHSDSASTAPASLRVLEQYPRAGQPVFAGTSVYLRLKKEETVHTELSGAVALGSASNDHSAASSESGGVDALSNSTITNTPKPAWSRFVLLGLVVTLPLLGGTCFMIRRYGSRRGRSECRDDRSADSDMPRQNGRHRTLTTLIVCATLLQASQFATAEQYILEDSRDPETKLIVEVSDEQLIVVTNPSTVQQREYTYTRFALLDTDDHLAYHRDASNMYIRWPVGGQGTVLRMFGDGKWQPIPQQIVLPQPGPAGPWSSPQPFPGYPPPPPSTEVTQLVPNQPLTAVTIELANTHDKELIVSLVDRRRPNARPVEFRIPPGSSVKKLIERDAGATQRTVLVSHTGETLGVVAERAVPPQSCYDVVVHEYKVVSTYIDRTGKDRLVLERFRPPSETYGARSIGVFPVPAGDQLDEGALIDVYEGARYQGNPGAARHFPMPRGIP